MKILYSVAGDGKGHATRSSVILNYLKNRHQIILAANNDAYEFFKNQNKPVNHLKGHRLVYKKNKVALTKTYLKYLINKKHIHKYNFNILRTLVKQHKPDVIISDFEPTSFKVAQKYKIPIISVDNQNLITNANYDVPYSDALSYMFSKKVISDFSKDADFYVISSFFEPELKTQNSVIVPPILRPELESLIAIKKDYVMVYQTSKTNRRLIKILRTIKQNFVIYGWNMEKKINNLEFRRFNERKFLEDLSECKALITNGGFTTITEALHLKKPILSLPIKNQFEQKINALHLDKLGYGEHVNKVERKRIVDFLYNLTPYEVNLSRYEPKTNHYTFQVFDYLLGRIHKRKKQNLK